MPAEDKRDPDAIEIAVWALHKIARQDYGFEPKGNEGRWELTIRQWEDDPVEPEPYSEFDLGDSLRRARLGVVTRGAGVRPILAGAAEIAAERMDVSEHLAGSVLRMIANDLPKMVERIESLRTLFVDEAVPPDVQVYWEEASACFIMGRYIASLVLCRSAIEFALRKRLGNISGTLDDLIQSGRDKLPWTLQKTLDLAEEIKGQANKAVHQSRPGMEVCRAMFDKTRRVLRELYTAQDIMGPLGLSAGAWDTLCGSRL